jgi:hypothetical protein
MIREYYRIAADLDVPLGQDTQRRRCLRIPVTIPQVIAALLGLFVATFAGWALVVSDLLRGEPIAVASTALPATTSEGPSLVGAPPPANNTVTIIDGSTGKRQVVPIAVPKGRGSPEQPLLEVARHGAEAVDWQVDLKQLAARKGLKSKKNARNSDE